jgi:hypothetical protein
MYKKIILTLLFGLYLKAEVANHIIFSRIVVSPDAAEMIAIYNPTDGPIPLSNYYLSDAESGTNKYYNLPTEENYWSSNFTDFIVRFPDIDINSQETIYISLSDGTQFEGYYGFLPNIILSDMSSAIEGQTTIGLVPDLHDNNEVLILFYWDGSSELVEDVDYFYWGDTQGLPSYGINKTDISTYEDDTSFDIQGSHILSSVHADGEAFVRVSLTEEIGETGPTTGITGNGRTGHD